MRKKIKYLNLAQSLFSISNQSNLLQLHSFYNTKLC